MVPENASLHFIGIGGIGVSAVARVALEQGYRVSGSDVRRSQLTDAMEALGARVTIGHAPANIDGADVVVVSTAIPEHNVELVEARRRGATVLHRSELLAQLVRRGVSVGVTGTHGKGTTSAMIAWILERAGHTPGFIIGGLLNNFGLNARAGAGAYMVAEVDESDGSHRNVPVEHLVVNFLEADHLNYYRDRDDIIESMIAAVDENDRLVTVYANIDCEGNRRLVSATRRPCVTYGKSADADYRVVVDPQRGLPTRFEVFAGDVLLGQFALHIPGRYNAVNAAGAVAVCHRLGVSPVTCVEAIASFRGLENRFTVADAGGGVTVVKDYNSHPTAIRSVLDSARDLVPGRIVSVFKPYRYTLTNYLKDEYATAFDGSDEVIITTMYAANEDPIPGVDTEFVVRMLRERGLRVTHIPDMDGIVPHLESTVAAGDGVLFFGGDDFFRMADAWCASRGGSQA